MTTARGKVRIAMHKAGELQSLIGRAQALTMNDRIPDRMDKVLPILEEAFNLCLEITGLYDPIDTKKAK